MHYDWRTLFWKMPAFPLNLLVFMVSREYFAEDECVLYFVALHFRECSTNWSPWLILNLKVYLFSFRNWFWCINKDLYICYMVSREYFAEDECVLYFVALHFRECSTNWSPWLILNLKVYFFSFRTWFLCMNRDVYICYRKVFAQWHGHLELCHNFFHVIYLLSCWRGDSPFN